MALTDAAGAIVAVRLNMLNIKEVEVLSYDTFRIGAQVNFRPLLIILLISLIPLGPLVYLDAVNPALAAIFTIFFSLFELLLYIRLAVGLCVEFIAESQPYYLVARVSWLVGVLLGGTAYFLW